MINDSDNDNITKKENESEPENINNNNNIDNEIKKHPKISNNDILIELLTNQLTNIPNEKKLLYNDLKRISKYLNSSIFTDECSLWTGYITVIKNDDKNSYINFYYSGKKYALHRLLYNNFIGILSDSEYIKFKCANKGICCNINHFYKINKDIKHVDPILYKKKDEDVKNNSSELKIITVNFNL
jgi:hypothetical protein